MNKIKDICAGILILALCVLLGLAFANAAKAKLALIIAAMGLIL